MAEHSHLLRDDLRGPLLPLDGLSHISRINDWQGSAAWVQGCRKDKPMSEGRNDYPEPKLPFKLLTNAYHEGAMRKAGEVVYIQPSKRGRQHAKIPGQEYPMLPEPVATEDVSQKVGDHDARITEMASRIATLENRIEEMERAFAKPAPMTAPAPLPPQPQAQAPKPEASKTPPAPPKAEPPKPQPEATRPIPVQGAPDALGDDAKSDG